MESRALRPGAVPEFSDYGESMLDLGSLDGTEQPLERFEELESDAWPVGKAALFILAVSFLGWALILYLGAELILRF